MMARSQIALSPEEHRRARARAAALGISLAEYVRRLVARDLAHPQRVTGPAEIFDLGDSGGSDVGSNKDAYLAEAVVESPRGRKRRPSGRRPPRKR